jgi:ribosomal protein L24
MSKFNPGDIVVIISGGLRGHIGVVRGEGNVWDYSVVVAGENYRLDPEQLHKIELAELIQLATPVPEFLLAFLSANR